MGKIDKTMIKIEWLHDNVPVELYAKIKKSVSDSSYGFKSNYICNKCNSKLNQIYLCPCGEQLKTGDIEKRQDVDTGIIYNEKDRKTFMEIKIDDKVKVEKEITKEELFENLYFLENPYEIYNNDDDDTKHRIQQIHNFLNKKGLALLVSFGYHGKEMGGVIVSTKDRLSLISLRDYRLIKEKYQIDLNERNTNIDKDLEAITESDKPILRNEFLILAKENKPIEKPVKIEAKKPKMIEIGFLEGF